MDMMCNSDDPSMMKKAFEDLRRCNKADFVPMGGMPVLLSVLTNVKTRSYVSAIQAGWETVTWLIFPDIFDVFVKEGFVPVLVDALKLFHDHPGFIEHACDTAHRFLSNIDSNRSFAASGGFYHTTLPPLTQLTHTSPTHLAHQPHPFHPTPPTPASHAGSRGLS